MRQEPPLAELGHFVIVFQAVEACLVNLLITVTDADPEYIGALAAELEFNSKARALDVVFARFAQIYGLCDECPHPEFHKLMSRVQKLATRRNDIVNSFYNTLITVDGQIGVVRNPTKLKPSEGTRTQPGEDILPGMLRAEIEGMIEIQRELQNYRFLAINTLQPCTK